MWKEESFHGEWVPGVTAGGSGQPNKGDLCLFSSSFINIISCV